MMIRRPSIKKDRNSCIECYEEINNLFFNIINIENIVFANREKIDMLIYDIISCENSNVNKKNYINVRRKIYNNIYYAYEDARPELLENKDIYEDYVTRKMLAKKRIEAKKAINLVEYQIKTNIQRQCENDEFIYRIRAANPSIYRLIKDNKYLLKTNHYLTILKNIYKQENCCTPSSLWSGIALIGNGGEDSIYGEINTHKKKYADREKQLKELSRKNKVFVNLTLWYSKGKYYYYKFDEDRVCKRAIPDNSIMELLYKEFRKKYLL